MDNDILRLLDDEEIHKISEILANDLPQSVLGFNFLKMYMKWQQTIADPVNRELVKKLDSDTVWRKLYTKRHGQVKNCTLVSISGDRDHTIFIFSYDANELKECIAKTNLINWSLGPAISGFDGKHYENMMEIIRSKRLDLEYDIKTDGYYLPKEEALKFNVVVPDDLKIGSIEERDYGLVNKLWTYCYPGSDTYMKCLILLNDNIALYDTKTNEIKSWAIIDEHFTVAMLNTRKEFYRKGYAAMIVKMLSKRLADRYDIGTFAFITVGNTNSEKCFAKLGFQNLNVSGHLIWLKVIKC